MTSDGHWMTKLVRDIPDYPKPGIQFRDITTLLGDARAFRDAVDALVQPHSGGVSILMPLHPAAGQPLAIDAVRDALAGTDALVIDLKAELDQLYRDYLREAILLSMGGLLAIVLLLAATLRSPGRLVAVMLPLVLSVLLVIAGLSLIVEYSGTRQGGRPI